MHLRSVGILYVFRATKMYLCRKEIFSAALVRLFSAIAECTYIPDMLFLSDWYVLFFRKHYILQSLHKILLIVLYSEGVYYVVVMLT